MIDAANKVIKLAEDYGTFFHAVFVFPDRLHLKVSAEECLNEIRAEVSSLQAENAALRTALADAIESVESWSEYASEYFQQKHDLAGDLARLRDAARGKT